MINGKHVFYAPFRPISSCCLESRTTLTSGISQRHSECEGHMKSSQRNCSSSQLINWDLSGSTHLPRKTQCFKIFHSSLSTIHKTRIKTRIKTGWFTNTTYYKVPNLYTRNLLLIYVHHLWSHSQGQSWSLTGLSQVDIAGGVALGRSAGHGMKFPTFAFGGADNDGWRGIEFIELRLNSDCFWRILTLSLLPVLGISYETGAVLCSPS